MRDTDKTKVQLIGELGSLRRRLAECEGLAAERRQAAGEARAWEERYRAVVDMANEAIMVGQDGINRLVNRKAQEMMRFSAEELMSRPFSEFIHPDDREMVMERYQRRLAGEELPSVYPFRVVTKDGTTRWVEVNATRITWEGRPADLCFLTDISERKRAEAERAGYTRRLEALHAVSDAVYQSLELEVVLDRALGKTMELTDADRGGVYLLDPETRRAVLRSHRGLSDGFVEELGVIELSEDEMERGLGWRGRVFDLGGFFTEDKAAAFRLTLEREGLRSRVVVPFKVRGVPRGALVLGSRSGPRFEDDEVELLQRISDAIAVAVDNAWLYERTRATVEALREREDTLNAILDAAPLPIFTLDRKGNVELVWNAAAERVLGWKKEEVLGRPYPAIQLGKKAEFGRNMRAALSSDGVRGTEARRRRRDGTPIDYSIYTSRLHDGRGKVRGIVAILLDITERRRWEDALRASEYRYRTAIETARDGILITDTHERIVDANRTFVEALGFGSKEEVIGRSIREFLTEPTLREMAGRLWDSVSAELRDGRGYVTNLELVAADRSGREVPIEVNVSRLADDQGQLTGLLHVIRDIGERREAEAAAERHARHLEAVHAVSRAVAQSLNLDEMLDGALAAAIEVAEVQAGYIHLLDRERRELVLRAHRGITVAYAEVLERLPITEEALKRWEEYPEPAFRTSKILEREAHGMSREAGDRSRFPPEGYATIPLWSTSGMYGGLSLLSTSPRRYTRDELELLRAIGNEIAVGIENARLYEQTRVALEAVRQSEEFSSSLLANSPNPITVVNPDASLRYVNPAFEELTGFSAKEVVGRGAPYPWWDQEAVEKARADLAMAMDSGVRRLEERFRKKNGEALTIEITAMPVRRDGQLEYLVSNWVDVTERRRMEDAVRASEEKYRRLVENAQEGIWAIDRDSRTVFANPRIAEMLGYSVDEMLGRHLFSFMDEAGAKACRRYLKRRRQGAAEQFDFEFVRKDGSRLHASVAASPVMDGDGAYSGALACVADITERKQAEERIQAFQRRLRSLASRLSLAEERERKRLAAVVHDQVAQPLVVVKMKLGALRQPLAAMGLSERLEEIEGLVDETMRQTRSFTFDLSPPVLYELGLEAGLEWLAEHIEEEHGIDCSFEDDGQSKPLGDDARGLLFQVARELLTNVVKHAAARSARVSIWRGDGDVHIRVEDDGVGFDAADLECRTRGFGLFSIRERLTEFGGRVAIESDPGEGTCVTVTAPLD